MNRQQKRKEMRTLAKDIKGIHSGSLPINQIPLVKARIKRLQTAGLIPKPKRTIVQTVKSFLGRLTGDIGGKKIKKAS